MRLFVFIQFCVWVALIVGWCMNIYKLATTTLPLAEFTIMEILRVIGIVVAPLGAVMGFL